MMNGKFNTNKYCTREMAACNFLPKYLNKTDKSSAAIGCAEAVSFETTTHDHCLQIQGHCKVDADCPNLVISSHPRHVLIASMAAKKDPPKTNKRRRETAHARLPVSGFPLETASENRHRLRLVSILRFHDFSTNTTAFCINRRSSSFYIETAPWHNEALRSTMTTHKNDHIVHTASLEGR
jgi:hypothetical protein